LITNKFVSAAWSVGSFFYSVLIMSDPDSSLAYDQPEQHSQDHLLIENAHWGNNHYEVPPNSHTNWGPSQHTPQDHVDYYATNNHFSDPGQ
jgi:hypothetical protein